jgi:hypothetical protein
MLMATDWTPVMTAGIAAVSAFIGGLLVAIVNAHAMKTSGERETEQRRRELRHRDIAPVYVRLLEAVLRGNDAMKEVEPMLSGTAGMPEPLTDEAQLLLTARVGAFASEDVRKLLTEWQGIVIDFKRDVSTVETGLAKVAKGLELAPAEKRAHDAALQKLHAPGDGAAEKWKRLTDQINKELTDYGVIAVARRGFWRSVRVRYPSAAGGARS